MADRHRDRTNELWTEGDVGYVRVYSKHGVFVVKYDAQRLEEVDAKSWNILCSAGKPKYVQAGFYDRITKKRATKTMHQYLFPDCPEGMVRDHINRDGFDNRSTNIRFVSMSTNNFNRGRKHKPGVSLLKRSGRYQAAMVVGIFDTEDEAHEAWLKAWTKLRGELPEFVNV